ncbi:MAG: LamG domain-containing protein [Colwellia sp.]|nr:LamG domain-containing protein [Colwellia sp.]
MAVSAKDAPTQIVISDSGSRGLPGVDGEDGQGFNQVRKSLIDNPVLHILKANKISEASAPTGEGSDVAKTRATEGSYLDRYQKLQVATIDTIREEKDGYLIESAGTNNALWSEDFSNALWVKQGGTAVTSDIVSAPDSTITADKLDFTVNGDLLRGVFINSSAVDFTFSIWVKSTSTDRSMELLLRNTPTSGNSSTTTVNATSEWQRFDVTLSSLSENIVMDLTSTEGAVDFYIWGAQLEQLPYPSSYIKTTTASVTRSADLVSLASENNLPDTSRDHSFIFNYKITNEGTTRTVLKYDTTGGQAWVRILSDGTLRVSRGGNDTVYDISDTRSGQIAIVYNEGVEYAYLDGALVGSDASITMHPLSLTTLYVGNFSGGSHIDGNLKDVKVYDFALNTDEITYLAGS